MILYQLVSDCNIYLRISSQCGAESSTALSLTRLQSFETDFLTQGENLAGLAAMNRELVAKAETTDSLQQVVLDMDSTEIPVYGELSVWSAKLWSRRDCWCTLPRPRMPKWNAG
jgi:hypothetical protein